MVRYRRDPIPGGTYFFTVVLADRRSTLLTSSIDALRTAFRTVRAERPFTIDAIVVLPDHLHAILTLPPGDADFALRWRRIKTVFTRTVIGGGFTFKPRDGGGHTVWQRRFWEHTIRDAADFARHVDYIHYNPIKHGYVADLRDWPFSSFHRYVREGILPPDWGKVAGDDDSREFGEPADRERPTGLFVPYSLREYGLRLLVLSTSFPKIRHRDLVPSDDSGGPHGRHADDQKASGGVVLRAHAGSQLSTRLRMGSGESGLPDGQPL